MHRRAAVTGALIIALATVSGMAYADGEVGGPPTSDFDRCSRELKPCGDPVVIGVGRHFNGPVEIVAFQSSLGLCIEVDVLREGASGTCPGEIHPPRGKAISAGGFSISLSRRSASTQVVGAVTPAVAAVRVRYRRQGRPKRATGLVAHVEGELQQRLEEEAPFAVFEATVRGCVPVERLRLAALDADGAVLGKKRLRAFRAFGDQCDRTPGSTTFGATHGRRRSTTAGWNRPLAGLLAADRAQLATYRGKRVPSSDTSPRNRSKAGFGE